MAQRGRPRKGTEKTKEPTQVKHPLIKAFAENYWVIPDNGGYCLYDKTRYCKRANAQYLGKFYISNNGDKYVFNDTYYSTIENLIEAMDSYNSTLPFSPEIYDPTYRKNYHIEMAVYDYLLSLGFKQVNERGVYGCIFELRDAYEQRICNIELETVQDTYQGIIRRWIFQNKDANRCIEITFNSLGSCIGACNSLIASYCTMLNVQALNVFKTMTNARCSTMLDVTFDLEHFSIETKDARQQTIEYLEAELKKLKSE